MALIAPSGGRLPVHEVHGQPGFSPERPRPATRPVLLLRPGDQADSFVQSSSWCGSHVAAWHIALPDGTSTTLSRGWTMGVCEDRASGSSLFVGGFAPPERRPRWPFVPMILDSPQHAGAGTIRYVVTLMNVQKHEFHFGTQCPPYEERIVQDGRVTETERLVLNCTAVGTVPGSTAVRFAMEMEVLRGENGPATLVWTLDPPYGFSRRVAIRL